MNKYEIETEILKELEVFLPKIKKLPFDKGLPLLQKEAWRLADKYDSPAGPDVSQGNYGMDRPEVMD